VSNLDALKDILRRSVVLWENGQHAEALRFLDAWIARAEEEHEALYVQQLSMHASVLAQSIGDSGLVKRYSAQVLSSDPGDSLAQALALYTLADALFREGEINLAKKYAARSYTLVADADTEEDRGLLELLINKWPEVREW